MISKNIRFAVLIFGLVFSIACNNKMQTRQQPSNSTIAPKVQSGPLIAPGQSYCGGIIFYVDSTGKHGLIAPARQEIYARWGCSRTGINHTSSEFGTGMANTEAILKVCTQSNCAARLCSELVLNGYDDWYLPSKQELDLLFANKRFFRPFQTNYYWSSTEINDSTALCIDFYDGHKMSYEKENSFYVHAIRSF